MAFNKTNIIISVVKKNDYSNLLPLVQQLGYPTTEINLLQNIENYLTNKNNVLFVAKLNNEIVGFISLDIVQRFYMSPFVDVSGIAVDYNYRKMGIGKLLIENGSIWAKSKGYSKIILKSGNLRKEAHLFYEKLGFIKKKEQYVYELNF